MTLRINCWSGPRNISTALMYSFRQRTDTTVVDEPIYSHYLEVSGRNHPGRNAVLTDQDSNGARVVEEVILGHYETPVVFFKQMCHHLVGLDRSFLGSCHNILLIREPRQVLRSHSVNLPDVKVTDIGLDVQVDLLETILANGDRPLVVDSAVLLRDPGAVLAKVCQGLGLPFEEAMLSWPAGPKPEDGVWARHWYQNAHRSTGFEAGIPGTGSLPDRLEAVLAEAQPLYDRLAEFSLAPS